jgi:hypothetical protein
MHELITVEKVQWNWLVDQLNARIKNGESKFLYITRGERDFFEHMAADRFTRYEWFGLDDHQFEVGSALPMYKGVPIIAEWKEFVDYATNVR